MRVLFTVGSLAPDTGGPARSVPALARALLDAGVDVRIWTNDIDSSSYSNNECCRDLAIYQGSFDQFDEVDLIHDHGVWLPNNHRVAAFAKMNRIPRIVSPRGMLEPWAINHKRWKKRVAWYLYQRKDLKSAIALHATAEAEAIQFRKLGLKQPVIVLPNGVALPLDASISQGKDDQPRNHNSVKTALFLGRIHPKKGLPMLVSAWNQLRPNGWRMQVVGPDEGGHVDELKAMVTAYGLESSWTFLPPVDGVEKWRFLTAADLFVLPTYSENFGIAVAEALAAGTPVITTTGAPWAGLETRNCGWWVEPTQAEILRVLNVATQQSDETRTGMGKRGKQWMQDEFSWERIGVEMADAYEWLIKDGKLPTCIESAGFAANG